MVVGDYRGGTDRVGFELTIPLRVYRFSRQTPRKQSLSHEATASPNFTCVR